MPFAMAGDDSCITFTPAPAQFTWDHSNASGGFNAEDGLYLVPVSTFPAVLIVPCLSAQTSACKYDEIHRIFVSNMKMTAYILLQNPSLSNSPPLKRFEIITSIKYIP